MNLRYSMLENFDQAARVGDLFRDVYADAYPMALYYHPEELWEANQAGRLYSAVATDENDIVVGHCALYNTCPNPRVLEAGAGLVHVSARREGAIARLFEALQTTASEKGLCDWLMIDAVCNHVATQKLAYRYGFVDTAVAVDHMPAAAYAREGYTQGRVSALLSFLPLRDHGGTVNFPERYRAVLQNIYDKLGVERQALTSASPPAPTSRVTAWRNQQASYLRVTVLEIGLDLQAHLEDDAEVFQLVLPLDSGALEFAVAEARKKGFFLAGVLPAWTSADNIMLQRLKHTTNWESIVLQSDFAKALLESVKGDR